MIDKTKYYKIDVSALNTAERTKLQEELFKMGYEWYDGIEMALQYRFKFLFLDGKCMTYCNDIDFFRNKNATTITVSDIMPQQQSKPEPIVTLQDISLRDYFAGLALAGSIACSTTEGNSGDFARYAYSYADAMLKEREKEILNV